MEKNQKKIFFNYATVGLMNPVVYKAASNFLEEYFRVGPPKVLIKYEQYAKKLSREVSILLHCGEDEVIYIKNTAEGIIIASEVLPLEKNDEVLMLGNEYPANLLAWLKKRKDGILLRIIDVTDNDNAKAFQNLLTSITNKTKVISISWGQYYDGYLPDMAVLSRICLEKHIFLLIDAVHGIGTRYLDLQKTPVDILVCGGQKYLGGIVGIGFMYINKKIMKRLKDFKVGIRSVKEFSKSSYILKDTAERFADGTQNILGIVALYHAIKKVNSTGIRNIERKNLLLLKTFKNCLYENNIPFIDHKNQSNIISLKIKNPVEFCSFLQRHSVYIKPVQDVARVSFSHRSGVSDFKYLVKKTREWLDRKEKQPLL